MIVLTWLAAGEGDYAHAAGGAVDGAWLVFWARALIVGVAAGGMLLMGISMLPDTMEWDRRRTGGLRREGIFSSAYAITEKAVFAIGPAIMGVVLSATGFISTTGGALAEQPETAVNALYAGVSFLPAMLLALSIVALFFYDLDEAKLKGPLGAGDIADMGAIGVEPEPIV
jgi:GPH family glycoside/pentoside/hexuronide:cation symporter